jgi:putative ABC transport system substrate-binding protein
MFGNHTGQIIAFAAKYRVPAIYPEQEYADEGGLLVHGRDVRRLFRRIATYVDRILKGGKPADLPVEQPTEFSSSSISTRPKSWASRYRHRPDEIIE